MRRLAWMAVVLGVALMASSAYFSWAYVGDASSRVVAGMRLRLPDGLPRGAGERDADCLLGARACRVEGTLDEQGRTVRTVRFDVPPGASADRGSRGIAELRVGAEYALRIGVAPRWVALLAALGLLAVVVFLPALLFGNAASPLGVGAAWSTLLSEPGGGLSLARVQLLVWFVPALLAYAAVSIPTLAFAPIDSTLAVLLGMSGATTALGTVASPGARPAPPLGIVTLPPLTAFPSLQGPAPVVAPAPEPVRLADLVEDWEGRGDFSRYQYLLLSLVGAVVLAAGFATSLSFPPLPSELVALIGASQATYLGTKAVKTARMDASAAEKRGG